MILSENNSSSTKKPTQVLVTGATGFIGARLSLKCKEKGYSVRALGLINNEFEEGNRRLLETQGIQVVVGSVTDRGLVNNIVDGVDIVFHLAAVQHEMNVPDHKFREVNVEGTRKILEASSEKGVKRFVHGSTIGVYGDMEGVIDELSQVNPLNIYGITKLQGEDLVSSFKGKISRVIIRIPETYGAGDRRLLKLFKGIRRRIFFMIGNGRNLHHLIYIDDLTEGLILAGETEDPGGDVFLMAGDDAVTTNEMAETIAGTLDTRIPKIRAPLFIFMIAATVLEKILRPLGVQPPLHRRRMDFFRKSFSFNISKARGRLGFSPRVGFREGIAETAKWYIDKGLLKIGGGKDSEGEGETRLIEERKVPLCAKMEPFDSFWEAPKDIEKGYSTFYKFYENNYLRFIPKNRSIKILIISCGTGYFLNLLKENGYKDVVGIDSDEIKINHGKRKGLNCELEEAFPYLEGHRDTFNVVIAEQEINHLTKEEIFSFLTLCRGSLKEGGLLLLHSLNGANPITGAEALAQNIDHFNTFTEYSLRQVLNYSGFIVNQVIPLNLYVFYRNPLNYVALFLDRFNSLIFRLNFALYGKNNRLFTKKIAAIARKADQGD